MNPDHCKAKIFGGYHFHHCSKKASLDGYCGTHHPDKVKARYDAKMAKLQARWDAKDAAREAVKAEREALELDARRYRWMLSQSPHRLAKLNFADLSNEVDFGMQLDESK